jgi:formamidopyrimidine-DNA glycosylase
MPELPEVETIVRGLKRTVSGKKIKAITIVLSRVLQNNPGYLKRNLTGLKIMSVKRRGKNIILQLSGGNLILIHLGMTGNLIYLKRPAPLKKHDHLNMEFSDKSQLRYNDPRKFGKFKLVKSSRKENIGDLKNLGPEPLEIGKDDFVRLFQRRKGRIKSILLNQRIIAGIGNIYADEALFESKIHPEEKPFNISSNRLKKLHQAIQKTLKKAIKAGGSSIDNYLDVEGKQGFFQFYHKAYGREGKPCLRCGTKIKRIVVNQRSSYFCPECQRKM